MTHARPSLALSTVVVTALAVTWAAIRIFLFRETVFPLTFVLPLLACVWTGRRWQLWSMAGFFCAMAMAKVFWILPGMFNGNGGVYLAGTLVNVLVGAMAVQMILSMREGLERGNAIISEQNSELEAQAEELSQQNEELKAQAEELAEQNEEIESQSEEVARQNEELVELSERLAGREEILEGLLQSSRVDSSTDRMLDELCRRALKAIGPPAAGVAILEQCDGFLRRIAHVAMDSHPDVPDRWPVDGSIAGVVLRERRTAYVFDLRARPDLALPFANGAGIRSVLATPLTISKGTAGLLVACAPDASHWTEEQFRVSEWIAAQCGLMMEILRGHQTLAEHAGALEAANRSKDRFLAMLSHELRTPLTPALAAASALERDRSIPENVREDIGMIRRNIGIQARLIDDLLDLTKISRGKVELDRRVLPVDGVLRDVAGIIGGEVDTKSQRLRFEMAELEGCVVFGDGSRLNQVFWNLLKNASKFSPAGSVIEVRGSRTDSRVTIEVRDEGEGLDGNDIDKIFLPFEQTLHGPRMARDGGLGLGLAIAKAIVELHDGQISVRSEGRGKGATFVVHLPVAEIGEAPAAPVHSTGRDEESPNGEPIRILLVEDHDDTRMIITRLLQGFGYHVEPAETSGAAFEIFMAGEFDLVVSDLGLPDESGLELMKRIRQSRPEVRGICLSGYGMSDDVAACREAGFHEHLTKPVDISRLQAAISRVASGSGAQSKN